MQGSPDAISRDSGNDYLLEDSEDTLRRCKDLLKRFPEILETILEDSEDILRRCKNLLKRFPEILRTMIYWKIPRIP